MLSPSPTGGPALPPQLPLARGMSPDPGAAPLEPGHGLALRAQPGAPRLTRGRPSAPAQGASHPPGARRGQEDPTAAALPTAAAGSAARLGLPALATSGAPSLLLFPRAQEPTPPGLALPPPGPPARHTLLLSSPGFLAATNRPPQHLHLLLAWQAAAVGGTACTAVASRILGKAALGLIQPA